MTAVGKKNPKRETRARDERLLLVTGGLGLAAAAFFACGGDDSNGTTAAEDAGTSGADATTSDASSGGGTTLDGGTGTGDDGAAAEDANPSSDGGTAMSQCTSSTATAANTASVVAAANALYGVLTASQQTTIQLTATLSHSEQWSNLPTTFITRNGVALGAMSADAQTAAIALVTAAASETGTTLFSNIRAADDWLVSDGKANASDYGDGRYYIAFIGTPSTTAPWMLQVAGHHLAYNFTYNGKCTSATPLFDGVEPTTWTDDAGTAHAPLESQRAAAVAVIAAISSNADSVLPGTFTDVVNGPTNSNDMGDAKFPLGLVYPTGTTGRGVSVSTLSSANQGLVKTAIEAWVKNAADDVSTLLLADYESDAAMAETWVGYSGATDLTTKNSYFRIDGPRVWIEYTIQGGIVYPSRVHYHTLWRDKAADYGGDYDDADAGAGAGTTTMGGDGGMGMMGGPPGGDGGFGGPPGDGGMMMMMP